MPELPEVETIARGLRVPFVGKTIESLWCNWPRMATPAPAQLQRRLAGARIAAITRRAKFLILHLKQPAHPTPGARSGTGHRALGTRNSALLIHLRMSGRLEPRPPGTPPAKHVHFVLRFADAPDLHFDDARKFGRVLWTSDLAAATASLGLEPLDPSFTPDVLADVLTRRSRQLKPALLDQSLVAGLGNIYTDEALHRARLHPLRKTDSLRGDDIVRLHASIIDALQTGIRHNGASIDWVYPGGNMQDHFAAYGRTDEPCGTCGTPIRRITVSQRGTHFCPRCQPAPRAGARRIRREV